MPINNELFGVFKTLKVGNKYIIAEEASQDRDMEAAQRNYIQGTAKNRIMDLGGVSENISIRAPILIGTGSKIDGRTLLSNQIANALLRTGATLPILQSAEISVSSEQGGMVTLQLQSDGNPENSNVFDVRNEDASALTDGTTTDILNPVLHTPTRVAKFFDFRVKLAGFVYFVRSATIHIEIEVKKEYFLGGDDGSTDDDTPIPASPNSNNFGVPYAWLGVSGVKVSGSGSIAQALTGASSNNDYDFTDPGEPLNPATGVTALTIQTPGAVVTVSQDFEIQVYDALTTQWVNLFADPNNPGEDLLDLSRSVVNRSKLNIGTGLITVDFDFVCYVK